jgi:hypothetical protein
MFHVVCLFSDNNPDWMDRSYDSEDEDFEPDVIDVQPFEHVSMRAVINTLPRSLTKAPSKHTPSTIITNYITLHITAQNDTWHLPDSKKPKKGTQALTHLHTCTRTHAHMHITSRSERF